MTLHTWWVSVVLSITATLVLSQSTGNGVSKSTYSANDPIPGWNFLTKYFPVNTPTDECTDNVCICPSTDDTPSWDIEQGRVYADIEGQSNTGSHAGNGFGLHLVNVSNHLTTGGLSTAEVEDYFTQKLGDMSTYDSFMDYNVVFSTSDLQGYKDAFTTDSVPYLAGTWSDEEGTSYTSIIVRVPGTQMILELAQQTELDYNEDEQTPLNLEQRVPSATINLNSAQSASDSVQTFDGARRATGAYITPLVVNRAASGTAMGKLEDFYDGLGAVKSHDSNSGDVSKKCFLWPGATVDVCYTQRPDSATEGDWKVGDFEDMLNTVHDNIIGKSPLCGNDKWEDNHYAIDSFSADGSKVIEYINANNPYHYCEVSTSSGGGGGDGPPGGGGGDGPPGGGGGGDGPPGGGPRSQRRDDSSSATLHYVYDPCGWGIQLDLQFDTAPDDCNTAVAALPTQSASRREGTFNPACDSVDGACAKTSSSDDTSKRSDDTFGNGFIYASLAALMLVCLCCFAVAPTLLDPDSGNSGQQPYAQVGQSASRTAHRGI